MIHKEFLSGAISAHTGAGKVSEMNLRIGPQFWGEGQLVPFSCQCPCLFCSDSEVLPGESWHGRDSYLSYSPDLMPAVFLVFPKCKPLVKGRRFKNTEDIKKNVTAKLNALVLCNFQKDMYRMPKNSMPKLLEVIEETETKIFFKQLYVGPAFLQWYRPSKWV